MNRKTPDTSPGTTTDKTVDRLTEGQMVPASRDLADEASHFKLLRDVLAFQFKLFLDGFRDVLLSPISMGAAILGVLTDRKRPGKYFYRLLDLGYETDRWIDLFNKHTEENSERLSPDAFVRHAETIVLNEYRKKHSTGQSPTPGSGTGDQDS